MKLEDDSLIEVKIKRIEQYGLIVQHGETEGLVHIMNISWDIYGLQEKFDSGELYKVGDTLRVKVLNGEDEPFSASVKHVFPDEDPWVKITLLDFEEVFEGVITQISDFGYFVEVLPGLRGIVYRTEDISVSLGAGSKMQVQFKEIDYVNKRVELSIVD